LQQETQEEVTQKRPKKGLLGRFLGKKEALVAHDHRQEDAVVGSARGFMQKATKKHPRTRSPGGNKKFREVHDPGAHGTDRVQHIGTPTP